MPSLSRKFFELIQFALGRREAFSEVPAEDDWERLYTLCRHHALIGIGFSGVEAAVGKKACTPPPLRLMVAWHLLAEKMERGNRLQQRDAVKISGIFAKEGFATCILKGQALVRLYGGSERRDVGDIDIWVWPAGGEGLSLCERRQRVASYCNAQLDVSQEVVYHHLAFPVGGRDIEVHFAPSWMCSPRANRRLQRFFGSEMRHCLQYLPAGCGGGGFNVPSPAMDRVFVLVHIYRHLFAEGIGLRQLLDYDRVLEATATDGERRDTMRQLQSLGLRHFTAAMMWVLHEVFALDADKMLCPPDALRGRRLLDEVMAAGNFGKYDCRGTVSHNYGSAGRFLQIMRRNLRFLRDYPAEVLCMPFWKLWHQICTRRWSPKGAVRR